MSDCACLYGGCDEPMAFQHTERRMARKAHMCSECREPIQRGQQYEYFFGTDDGEVWTHRTCLLCAEIRDALYCKGEGYYFSQLWEDIRDQMFVRTGLNSACLDKLRTPEAKQFLSRRWWAWVQEQTERGQV